MGKPKLTESQCLEIENLTEMYFVEVQTLSLQGILTPDKWLRYVNLIEIAAQQLNEGLKEIGASET